MGLHAVTGRVRLLVHRLSYCQQYLFALVLAVPAVLRLVVELALSVSPKWMHAFLHTMITMLGNQSCSM